MLLSMCFDVYRCEYVNIIVFFKYFPVMAWIMQSAMVESLRRPACDRNDQVGYVTLFGLPVHIYNFVFIYFFFSASTLLVGWQEGVVG